MVFLNKIFNMGIKDSYSPYHRNKVRSCNQISLVLIVLTGIYAYLTYHIYPQKIFTLIVLIINFSSFVSLLLNSRGFNLISRLNLSTIPILFVGFFHAYGAQPEDNFLVSLYFSQCAFALFPWILFDFREKAPLAISVVFNLSLLVVQSSANEILQVQGSIPVFTGSYLSFITFLFGLLLLVGSMTYLQKNLIDMERQNQNLLEMKSRNLDEVLKEHEKISINYRALNENAQEIIYHITLPDRKYQYVSPASEHVLGYAPEEFYEDSTIVSKIIAPQWRSFIQKEWEKILSGEIKPFYEYEVITKAGKRLWIHQKNNLIRDDQGKLVAVEGAVKDITEEKKKTEEIEKSHKMLKTFMENAPFGVLFSEKKGNVWHVVSSNNEYSKIYKINEEDLRSIKLVDDRVTDGHRIDWKVILPDGNELPLDKHPVIAAMLTGKQQVVRDLKILRNDNTHSVVYCIATPIFNDQGEVTGVIDIVQDMSKYKKFEDELMETELLLEAAIEQSPAGIMIMDAMDRKIRIVNSTAYEIMGHNPSALENLTKKELSKTRRAFYPDGTICPPEDLPLSRAMVKGETSRNVELIIKHENGDSRLVIANAAPIKNRRGDVIAGVVVFSDITEQKKLEEQLRQVQKMEAIGNLAGGIAHDFNNILGAIVGSCELLNLTLKNETLKEPEEVFEYISTIVGASGRATETIKQLLTLSRKQKLEFSSLNINSTIKNIKRFCQSSFPKSIELDFHYNDDLLLIKADSVQIEQVILNLCINASHAMTIMRGEGEKQGGVISVSIEKVYSDPLFCVQHSEADLMKQYVVIIVRDNGVGMDLDVKKNIFNPFFTTKDKEHGTGLGLSIVYNIMNQHNGFLDVDSRPGKGTTFKLYFPELIGRRYDSGHSDENKPLVKGSGKILVIDDEKVIRSITRKILEKSGYEVVEAKDGESGVTLYEQDQTIAAVILDLSMPKKSGLEVYKELKAINNRVKVMMVSGFKQDKRVKEALELGVNSFIQKPYSPVDLTGELRRITTENN